MPCTVTLDFEPHTLPHAPGSSALAGANTPPGADSRAATVLGEP
jgi:hypothetical protein